MLFTKWYKNNENECRTAGHVAVMVDEKCIQNILRKVERKRTLGRSRCKWIKNKFICV